MNSINVEGVQTAALKQLEAIRGIEVDVRIKAELLVPIATPQTGFEMRLESYREAGPDQRWYILAPLRDDGTPVQGCRFGYRNGNRSATVIETAPGHDQPRTIFIHRDFMDENARGFTVKPFFLAWRDVGLTPLHAAIFRATRAGTETVCERPCTVYHFPGVAGARSTQTLVYALDDRTAVPMKVTAYANSEAIAQGRPNWEWITLEFASIGNLWYARKSRYTSYDKKQKDQLVPQIVETHVVERVELGKSFKETAFWPRFQPGDRINDLTEKKFYFNTPDGKPLGGTPKPVAEVVANPIRAVENEGANDLLWSLAALWAGVALVACGIALKMRSRQSKA